VVEIRVLKSWQGNLAFPGLELFISQDAEPSAAKNFRKIWSATPANDASPHLS
jgi:hypothetical protein